MIFRPAVGRAVTDVARRVGSPVEDQAGGLPMHPSELESRIFQLRARVRRLLALHGLSLLVALLVPLVIVAVLADWLIHLDAAVRMALLLGLIGLGGWLAYRHVITPLVVRFRDLDIALRIERRWPGLNDRLASTVQFFRIATTTTGSARPPCARRRSGRRWKRRARSTSARPSIAARRSGCSGGRRGGRGRAPPRGGLAPAERDRPAAALPADGRRPLAQQTHLSLVDAETRGPWRAASRSRWPSPWPAGRAPLVGVGDLPLRQWRECHRGLSGLQEGGLFRGRIESVTRPFTFSVAAGDDSTSIRDVAVKVVPPPTLTDLTIRLISPPYTGLPEQTLASGRTQVRAVEGTRVMIEARANKPIETASLHLGEKSAGAPMSSTRLDGC
jgi:hypothetical protein